MMNLRDLLMTLRLSRLVFTNYTEDSFFFDRLMQTFMVFVSSIKQQEKSIAIINNHEYRNYIYQIR